MPHTPSPRAQRYLKIQEGLIAARLVEPLSDREEEVFAARMDILSSPLGDEDRAYIQACSEDLDPTQVLAGSLPHELRRAVQEEFTINLQVGAALAEAGLFEKSDQVGILRSSGYVRNEAGDKVAAFLEGMEAETKPRSDGS